MNRLSGFFFLIGTVFLSSCKNSDKKDTVDPDIIYFDYKITGQEGDDNLTVMLQYKDGDE